MKNLKRLFPYLLPQKRNVILGTICMVLSGSLDAVVVYLIYKVLKPILDTDSPDRLARVNLFALVLFATALFRVFVDYGTYYLSQRTGQRVLAQLREDLFTRFQDLPIGFFERRRTGELMSRLTNDMGLLQSILTMGVVTAISSPVALVGSVALMFRLNWQLTLFVLVLLPVIAGAIVFAGRKIRVATTHLQLQLAELNNYLQEKLSAMRLIQTFGTRNFEVQAFHRVNWETYGRTIRPVKIQSVLSPTIEFIGVISVLGSLLIGVRTPQSAHDPASLAAFLIAVNLVGGKWKQLAGLSLNIRQGDAAAERLFEILDTKSEVDDAPDAVVLDKKLVTGHLKFAQVCFAYGSGPEVLHGIDFDIAPGEVVALAGSSGSGKSTIASLVPRLYDPTAGEVSLDGCNLRGVTMLSLRNLIGAVPQETILFHGTLRDNIAYGSPNASDEQVREAAQRANAAGFIEALKDGYQTQIGERGGRLSGGERQRIAIARALLRDPRILILDEATSSLDAESEGLVQEALDRLMQGRTTLIIAHRFSTIQRAHRILVLDKGNIVEVGNHQELLARRGRYYDLYQRQVLIGDKSGEAEAGEELAVEA